MTRQRSKANAVVLFTGDELLRGVIQDANSQIVARTMRDVGITTTQIRFIPDDLDGIVGELQRCISDQVAVVIIAGGLGPTHDDRTTEAVAKALELPLECSSDALAIIEDRVRSYGRRRSASDLEQFADGNRKQATFPQGAEFVDPLGTAPGYVATGDVGTVVLVVPGPPAELRHSLTRLMDTAPIQSVLRGISPPHERLVRIWGRPESHASHWLSSIGHDDRDEVTVTLCARDSELELGIRGSDASAVDELTAAVADEFGSDVFAVDDDRPIVEIVAEMVQQRELRVAVAESCTGGMLGAMCTSVAGSSSWFVGGVIAYDNSVKSNLLHVDAAVIERDGAVSEAVAQAMAEGVAGLVDCEIGLGITGVAGPGGGTEQKPVGTVVVGISLDGETQVKTLHMRGDRESIRRRSCVMSLHILRKWLLARS